MSTQPDFDKMSNAELEELAQRWASGEVDEQPRDESGKFVKKDDAPVVDEQKEEIVYERVIDLGDGSGVQVFEAPTMEELVEKLAKAQENATRKIREQAAQLRQAPKTAPVEEVENLTDEQKFMLQQEMLTDPAKALSRLVNQVIEKRERVQADSAAREKSESDAFVANTPDYFVSQKNGERMVKYLETYQLEASQDNLKKAFNDLNSSGLLESRPADKETPVTPEGQPQAEARIEQKPATETVVRRRVVGGVSVKRSAPAPVQATGLTEKQLYDMPMHELEALALQDLRG